MTLGERIKKYRKEKQWTQKDLAEKAGIGRQKINYIENNSTRRNLTVVELKKIAKALDVSIYRFFDEEGDDEMLERDTSNPQYLSPGTFIRVVDTILSGVYRIHSVNPNKTHYKYMCFMDYDRSEQEFRLINWTKITKASLDINDVLEAGDYVNGKPYTPGEPLALSDIDSIVTKNAFAMMKTYPNRRPRQ